MAHFNAESIALQGEFIRQMLKEYGDRADKDGQHLSGSSQRYGQRDAGADALMADDNKDSRYDGGQRSIRRHGGADIHPAERQHFERTAKYDSGRDIAEHQPDQCAGDERTVELALIEHASHTGHCRDDDQ